jgi:hypothetical protein
LANAPPTGYFLAMRMSRLTAVALSVAVPVCVPAAATAEGGGSASPSYKVPMHKLCESFGRHLRCKGGYVKSQGRLVHYSASYHLVNGVNTVFLKGEKTSCTSLTVKFILAGSHAHPSSRVKILSSSGTKRGTSTGTAEGSVTANLHRGPFRASGYYSDTYGSASHMDVNGSATCSTRSGKPARS